MGSISGCMIDENHDIVIYGNADGRPYLMRGDPSKKMEAQEYLTLEPIIEDKDDLPGEF